MGTITRVLPKKWQNASTRQNSIQKLTSSVRDFILGVCMAIIIVGVCYIILSPIFGIISRAFMAPQDMANPLIFLIPQNFTLDHVNNAITYMGYWASLASTLLFSFSFSIVHVIIGSMVGYGFARFRFPGANVLFALVIVTIVVPVQAYMVPMFINFRFFMGTNHALTGTPWALFLLTLTGVGLRSGLYIYIFRQFFRGLPKEIEEAALIDGAGALSTFVRVMLPNALPAIITVFLFAFVWHYNDTFYTSLLWTGNDFLSTRLMSLGHTFENLAQVRNPLLIQMVVFAGVMLAILPILTIYLFLQRYFVEGLERSGIVG